MVNHFNKPPTERHFHYYIGQTAGLKNRQAELGEGRGLGSVVRCGSAGGGVRKYKANMVNPFSPPPTESPLHYYIGQMVRI